MTHSVEVVINSGVLFKRGSERSGIFGRGKRWKPRFFVLTANKLKFFTYENGKLKGEIDLSRCTPDALEVMPERVRKKGSSPAGIWRIALTTTKYQLVIAAGSENEMNQWANKLGRVIRFHFDELSASQARLHEKFAAKISGLVSHDWKSCQPEAPDFGNLPRRSVIFRRKSLSSVGTTPSSFHPRSAAGHFGNQTHEVFEVRNCPAEEESNSGPRYQPSAPSSDPVLQTPDLLLLQERDREGPENFSLKVVKNSTQTPFFQLRKDPLQNVEHNCSFQDPNNFDRTNDVLRNGSGRLNVRCVSIPSAKRTRIGKFSSEPDDNCYRNRWLLRLTSSSNRGFQGIPFGSNLAVRPESVDRRSRLSELDEIYMVMDAMISEIEIERQSSKMEDRRESDHEQSSQSSLLDRIRYVFRPRQGKSGRHSTGDMDRDVSRSNPV